MLSLAQLHVKSSLPYLLILEQMGKKKAQSSKYGAPLYCAAWPPGGYVLVAGGGGKKSSGIPNKYVSLYKHIRKSAMSFCPII